MSDSRPDIAVVGVSALFPGSSDADGFWKDILAGTDLISDVPTTHWLPEDYYDADPSAPDKTYAKRGGFLEKVDFDALGWGVPPSIIPATDTSQLLALIVAEQVLRDATGSRFETADRSRTSVILGVTSAQELLATMVSRLQRPVWVKSLREHGLPESDVQAVSQRIADHYEPWQESSFPGLLGNVVAGRIANRLDLGGTNCVTDAACASTFSALSMAVNELYLGDSDMVITGGVDTLNDIFMFMCFSKTPALSISGDVRPFSDSADGTMLGEGLGMVALKRLSDAERDGDRVYAVIRGVGSSSDGRSKSVYAPVSAGQAKALTRAYSAAGFAPDSIELIEAHGTGTKAGDKAEFGGLELAFGQGDRAQWCALGTVKSQIGHTKAAAGAAGLFKAVMALHHKVLPPTIKVVQPNPTLHLEASPFYVNTEARPWIRGSAHPRRAGVSAFGFGGSNFHVALEEYSGEARPPRSRALASELVLLSGASGAEVAAAARSMVERCDASGLQRLAWESAQSWDSSDDARMAVVATDAADLKAQLHELAVVMSDLEGHYSLPNGSCCHVGSAGGKVAFVFPGQGSQYVGMGADLAMAFDVARGPWDRAADVRWDGTRLDEVVYPIPRFNDSDRAADTARLTSTEWAQPGIGCTSLSMLSMLRALGVKPDAVAGHSFGELTALHAAGVLDEVSFLAASRTRGELMKAAADVPGGMLAVSAPIEAVEAALVEGVVVANHNHPRQVVVSGPTDALVRAEASLKDAGLRVTRLPVATAFHSSVVAGSVEPYATFLEDLSFDENSVPVWSGELAAPYEVDAGSKRDLLARQIARPVRWTSLVEGLADEGVTTFIEVGPGSVLTGLVGRTLGERAHHAVTLDRKGKDGVVSLLRGVATLGMAGVPFDPMALWEGYGEPADPAAATKPRLAVPINGANYGKAYPPAGGAKDLPSPNPERVEVQTPLSVPRESAAPALHAPSPQASVPTASVPEAPPQGTPTLRAPVAVQDSMAHVSSAPTPQWLGAWEEAQRQNAQAHSAFQQAMANSHTAFMQTVEASLSTLSGLHSGSLTPVSDPLAASPPAPVFASGLVSTVATPGQVDVPSLAPVTVDGPAVVAAPSLPAVVAAPSLPAVVAAPSLPAAASVDLHSLMLSVVSEKTGYPSDMLDVTMDLEGDLGIDSIKRVEILAAVQDQAPGMPDVDASHMGTLSTLGEIVDYMQSLMPASSAPVAVDVPAVVAAPSLPAATLAQHPELARYVLSLEPVPAAGLAQPGLLAADEVLITSDGGALAPALAAEFQSRGVTARATDEVPAGASAVVFLGGLRAAVDDEQSIAVAREGFRAARAVANTLTERGGLFVTVQDTGGQFGTSDFAPSRAWLGSLAALVKTASQEWPKASLKAIDLERGGRDDRALAAVLADELLLGGGDLEVGLDAAGVRRAPRSVDELVSSGTAVIGANDVVVVSGGARGVTASCVIAWAHAVPARFVLLGRSVLSEESPVCAGITDDAGLKRALLGAARASGETLSPRDLSSRVRAVLSSREIRATLTAIEAAGAQARYVSASVTDPVALSAAFDEVRAEWGPVRGLVHGAGVLADRKIAEQTDAQFDRVWDTKIEGLRALLAATTSDPLALLCLFSSVSARCGNNGQVAYAMANEALNKAAQAERRRRPNLLVKSMGWGPWRGGMVNPQLEAHFAALGVPMIPLDVGAQMFVDEVSAPSDRIELVLGGEPRPEALLVEGIEDRRLELDVAVGAATHPWLRGHRINGVVVVPVVLVTEWFVRLARAFRPDLTFEALRDVSVVRGIKLRNFDGAAERFALSCRQVSNGHGAQLAVELRDSGGALLYRAQASMAPRNASRISERAPSAPRLNDWGGAAIYGDVLFHSDDFRVIRDLDGVGPEGISGTLAGVRDAGWVWEDWHTDVAALDGGLQLVLLWARNQMNGAALPMGIQELRLHEPLAGGLVRCVARCASRGSQRALAEVVFLDANGRLVAELRGVELVLRPDANRVGVRA